MQALDNQPTLEVRRRLRWLLERLAQTELGPHRLLALRVIEVLEQIGNAEARNALRTLVSQAPGIWLRQEARASLERLAKRP
jgi:hypothetical protein